MTTFPAAFRSGEAVSGLSNKKLAKAMPVKSVVDSVITVKNENCPSGAETVRAKSLWPLLLKGTKAGKYTVGEWHKDSKEFGGVPSIYLAELVNGGYIELDPMPDVSEGA